MRKYRLLSIVLMLALCLALSACGSQKASGEAPANQTEPAKETAAEQPENTSSVPDPTTAPAEPEEPAETAGTAEMSEPEQAEEGDPAEDEYTEPVHSEVLVVYFSATGTTKGVAERIAAVTGADLYEIVPAEPYSDADLDYNDSSSRSTKEQNDTGVRPAIASETLDLAGYTTIYIGFPIWWGEEPRIMDTFAESYDFTGITLIPFCTSGGSGIGRSGPNMEELAGSGTWLDGRRFDGDVSESELQSWIDGLQ